MYTIKLLLTEISVHTGNIVLTFKAHGPHCVRSIRLECQNKYFLEWTSSSVNKSIIYLYIYIYISISYLTQDLVNCVMVIWKRLYTTSPFFLICKKIDPHDKKDHRQRVEQCLYHMPWSVSNKSPLAIILTKYQK